MSAVGTTYLHHSNYNNPDYLLIMIPKKLYFRTEQLIKFL